MAYSYVFKKLNGEPVIDIKKDGVIVRSGEPINMSRFPAMTLAESALEVINTYDQAEQLKAKLAAGQSAKLAAIDAEVAKGEVPVTLAAQSSNK